MGKWFPGQPDNVSTPPIRRTEWRTHKTHPCQHTPTSNEEWTNGKTPIPPPRGLRLPAEDQAVRRLSGRDGPPQYTSRYPYGPVKETRAQEAKAIMSPTAIIKPMGRKAAVGTLAIAAAMAIAALFTLSVSGTPARAQSPVDNGPVPYDLPSTSPLIPPGLGVDDQFRLLHLTDHQLDVSLKVPPDYYDNLVAGGAGRHPETYHPFLRAQYRIVASDANATAKENTATFGTGVPIYWLNGGRIADDYHDFYDGDWDSVNATDNLGRLHRNPGATVWTGSAGNGEPAEGQRIGDNSVAYGNLQSGGELHAGTMAAGVGEFYAISPVFNVVNPEDIVRPPMPAAITTTAGPQEIVLSWEPSERADGYWIQRRTPSGYFFLDQVYRVSTAPKYADTGVVPGQKYIYRVRAHTGGTLSKCCSPPAQVRASRQPRRVTGVATYPFPGRENGAEIMAVHWDQADGRDYPVTNYVLRRTAYRDEAYEGDATMLLYARSDESAGDIDFSFKYRLTSDGGVEYVDSRAVADPEITYVYELKAVSAVGRSRLWSEPVFSLEDYRPAQIAEISATDGGAGRVRLDWAAPEDHGNAIDRYQVAFRYGHHGYYHPQAGSRRIEGTSYLSKPMQAGAIAYLKARAFNRYGYGPWSEPVVIQSPA